MPRTTTKKTTKKLLTMPKPAAPLIAQPTLEEIAHRAFELYCERGGHHGNDLQDWLQAERELLGATTSSAA